MATILLVDDTKTVVMLEAMMLKKEGFDVATASTGLEAIEKVRTLRPALVIMDIMMPGITGIEACKCLKSDPTTKTVPVIIVTTKGESSMVLEAYSAGCDDYMTKPVDKTEMIAKIRKLLNH